MADKTLKGINEILFLHDGTAYLPIGCLTSNSVSKTVETQDGTITKCDSSPEPTYGRKSYEVSFDAVAVENNSTKASYTKASQIMDSAFDNKTSTYWKIVSTGDTVVTQYGKGILTTLEKEAPAEGEVTFSGTIVGIGNISSTDLATTTTTTL